MQDRKETWKKHSITCSKSSLMGVITQGSVPCSWTPWGQTPVLSLLSDVTLLVCYCCIKNYHELRCLKQCTFIISVSVGQEGSHGVIIWVLCSGSQKFVISFEAQALRSSPPVVCWQDSMTCGCKTGNPSPRGHLPFPTTRPSPQHSSVLIQGPKKSISGALNL